MLQNHAVQNLQKNAGGGLLNIDKEFNLDYSNYEHPLPRYGSVNVRESRYLVPGTWDCPYCV